jgi:quinone-modifying oxidoreductase, subunit QmoA
MSGNGRRGKILVIGGGISGLTAAIEAAEAGAEVVLVEKEAFMGGRVARSNLYFPKMCPPACGG